MFIWRYACRCPTPPVTLQLSLCHILVRKASSLTECAIGTTCILTSSLFESRVHIFVARNRCMTMGAIWAILLKSAIRVKLSRARRNCKNNVPYARQARLSSSRESQSRCGGVAKRENRIPMLVGVRLFLSTPRSLGTGFSLSTTPPIRNLQFCARVLARPGAPSSSQPRCHQSFWSPRIRFVNALLPPKLVADQEMYRLLALSSLCT